VEDVEVLEVALEVAPEAAVVRTTSIKVKI
jgi:hypothetical protein